MDLVSIIVPVHNAEKHLEQCVHSIIKQTYQNIEVWLVYDRCDDDSLILCERLRQRDPRVHAVYCENSPNRGYGALRNHGIDCVSGTYTMFVDCHGLLTNDAVERLVATIQAEQSDVVVCNYMKFNDETNKFLVHINDSDYRISNYTPKEWLEQNYEYNQHLHYCYSAATGKLYKSSLLKRVSYPVNTEFEEDYTQYKIYLLADRITFENKAYYIARDEEHIFDDSYFSLDRYNLEFIEERITLLAVIGFDCSKEALAFRHRLKMNIEHLLNEQRLEEYTNATTIMKLFNRYYPEVKS